MNADTSSLSSRLDSWLERVESVQYVRSGVDVRVPKERSAQLWVVCAGGALRVRVESPVVLVECGGLVEANEDALVIAIPNLSGEWPCEGHQPGGKCLCATYAHHTYLLAALLRSPVEVSHSGGAGDPLLRVLADVADLESVRGIDPSNHAAIDFLTGTDWREDSLKLALCLHPNP